MIITGSDGISGRDPEVHHHLGYVFRFQPWRGLIKLYNIYNLELMTMEQ